MAITLLDPSPNGLYTHGDIREKINEIITFVNRPDLCTVGFFDYEDSYSISNNVVMTANVPVIMQNDTLGPNTERNYAPLGVTDIWNPSTNAFDFSELNVGDTVALRVIGTYTPSMNNASIRLDMNVGIGSPSAFTIPVERHSEKQNGVSVPLPSYMRIYIGSEDVRNNPAQLVATSDVNAVIRNYGMACFIERRGAPLPP